MSPTYSATPQNRVSAVADTATLQEAEVDMQQTIYEDLQLDDKKERDTTSREDTHTEEVFEQTRFATPHIPDGGLRAWLLVLGVSDVVLLHSRTYTKLYC